MIFRSMEVKPAKGGDTKGKVSVPEKIEGDAGPDGAVGSNAVDGLLHFTVAAVGAFDGVGGGWKETVIQESQCFFQCGGLKFGKSLRQGLEANQFVA
jgi:hypothetical protein